jgi:hypothetical protein
MRSRRYRLKKGGEEPELLAAFRALKQRDKITINTVNYLSLRRSTRPTRLAPNRARDVGSGTAAS